MKHIFILSICGILLSLIFVFSYIGSVAAKDNGTIQACFTDWPPYTQSTEDGAKGVTIELLTEAARRASYGIEFTNLPWKRCLVLVESGKIDLAMDVIDRPGFIHGKNPSSLWALTFWTHSDKSYGELKDLNILIDKRLGLVRGFKYPEEILNGDFKYVEKVPDLKTAAMLIAGGRLDLVFADVLVMYQIAQKHNLNLKPLRPIYSVQPLYPSFGVDRIRMTDDIDAALGEMHEDGTVDMIYESHTGIKFTKLQDANY